MALKVRPVLGIEIHPTEIRVLELVPEGAGWIVANRTELVPAPNFIGELGILEPQIVGRSLRSILDRAGITTTDAVFGLPPQLCAIRAISVPPVEGSELRSIVEGEIELARVFRTPNSSFDLVYLNDSKLLDSGGRSVLVLGSELEVLGNIREVATAAGLRVEAIEPTHMALYRGAYLQSARPPNLVLTLSDTYAELAILDSGKIALHRAFDLGSPIFAPAAGTNGEDAGPLDLDATGAIAIELRRTIDFVARELPDAPPTEEILIAATHERAPLLAEWLQNSLRIRCRLADLGGAPVAPVKGLPESGALRHFAAHSLTLRPPIPLPEGAPAVDLLSHEKQRQSQQDDINRKFRIAFLAACAVLTGSALASVLGTVQANGAAEKLKTSKAHLVETQAYERQKKQEAAQKAERLTLLSHTGVEVSGLVRSVVRTLPSTIGLTEVRMTADGAEVAGEALSEASIIAMSDRLRQDSRFLTVSVTSFERLDPRVPSAGMRFRMQLRVPQPPPPPSATPAAGATS